MGCDIHSFAEIKKDGKWQKVEEDFVTIDNFEKEIYKKEKGNEPFYLRSYSVFGFLADVRNYSCCQPISIAKGLPKDSEYLNEEIEDNDWYQPGKTTRAKELEELYYHSYSYLTLEELLNFDYEQIFWDRRVSKKIGPNSWTGSALAEEGEGCLKSYREHLGAIFFQHLEDLKTLGSPDNVRVVFYFDN